MLPGRKQLLFGLAMVVSLASPSRAQEKAQFYELIMEIPVDGWRELYFSPSGTSLLAGCTLIAPYRVKKVVELPGPHCSWEKDDVVESVDPRSRPQYTAIDIQQLDGAELPRSFNSVSFEDENGATVKPGRTLYSKDSSSPGIRLHVVSGGSKKEVATKETKKVTVFSYDSISRRVLARAGKNWVVYDVYSGQHRMFPTADFEATPHRWFDYFLIPGEDLVLLFEVVDNPKQIHGGLPHRKSLKVADLEGNVVSEIISTEGSEYPEDIAVSEYFLAFALPDGESRVKYVVKLYRKVK